eukprot:GHRR01004100.1.p4 GENE.GHRR01004100.1~~GHRR01004100.1.p4  ORF type:complete len:109 (+),score=17.39 GHRR01004100.1:4553-4879(+)
MVCKTMHYMHVQSLLLQHRRNISPTLSCLWPVPLYACNSFSAQAAGALHAWCTVVVNAACCQHLAHVFVCKNSYSMQFVSSGIVSCFPAEMSIWSRVCECNPSLVPSI